MLRCEALHRVAGLCLRGRAPAGPPAAAPVGRSVACAAAACGVGRVAEVHLSERMLPPLAVVQPRAMREARTWHLCELASSPAAGTSTILCGRNRHVTADLVRRYVISRSGYIIWARDVYLQRILLDVS